MRRRATSSVFGNPVLVGAVTTLIVVIAVFLAYNANNGLPFVPTRELKVQLPNGAELVKGNEVREGGFRVGLVSAMEPTMLPNGTVGALATLKLDKVAGALPVDTTVVVRPRSALGLKFVEITKGNSSKTIPDGGTLPLAQVGQETDLDQVYAIFDKPTRDASQTNLTEFGNALAGRGTDINTTIHQLPATFKVLTPVMQNLSNPSTRLDNFFKQLEITAGTIAPVAATNAHLFTTMANTWAAISRDPQALKDTISKSPPTEDVGTTSFRAQLPFLRDTVAFSRDLNTATGELRAALPTLNGALHVAVPVTKRSVGLYQNLTPAMTALRDLATAPTTNAALRGLTATVGTLQPQLRFLGPYVTVCNDFNYFFTLLGEHFSEPDPTGSAQRALVNSGPNQHNSFSSEGAAQPANGQGVMPGPPGQRTVPEYLHGAANGAAITDSGQADCEAGQRGYIHGGKLANKFGNPTDLIEVDAHTPLGYRHGPTFAKLINGQGVGLNPDHVPAGETFTREPGGIGMQAP